MVVPLTSFIMMPFPWRPGDAFRDDAVDVVQQDAADVVQHDAIDVVQHDTEVDDFGNPIPPHLKLAFYGRRMCRSPSPPQAPVQRYRYGNYILEGRRLPNGGFQALSWISGPRISSPSMSSTAEF